MDTRVAPSFANLFMNHFEEKFVYAYKHQPLIWLRFIDDIFCIWTNGVDTLMEFINHLNKSTSNSLMNLVNKTSASKTPVSG